MYYRYDAYLPLLHRVIVSRLGMGPISWKRVFLLNEGEMCNKTYMRGDSRHPSRKRRWKDDAFVAIAIGIIIILLALKYWDLFLCCLIILFIPVLVYIIFKITKHFNAKGATGQLSRIVRDTRYISPRLRQDVWTKCGGRCVQCKSSSYLEYDHIIPLSRGGATSYGNLQILCRTCNRRKSNHI